MILDQVTAEALGDCGCIIEAQCELTTATEIQAGEDQYR